MVELYLHSPICLHGIMPNYLSTGTTLPFYLYVYVSQMQCGNKDNARFRIIYVLLSSLPMRMAAECSSETLCMY
jgi:hypothetical protein